MGTGEDRFWQEVGNQLNPGWQIHLGPGGVQVPLASQDTFLYLFDTATMWITGGATLSSEMLRARRELQKLKMTPAQVAGLAAEPILECSQAQLTGDHPKVRLAMTAAHGLHARGGKLGLATMCVGVGQGVSLAIEKV